MTLALLFVLLMGSGALAALARTVARDGYGSRPAPPSARADSGWSPPATWAVPR